MPSENKAADALLKQMQKDMDAIRSEVLALRMSAGESSGQQTFYNPDGRWARHTWEEPPITEIIRRINEGDNPITNLGDIGDTIYSSGLVPKGPFEVASLTATSVTLWASALTGAGGSSFIYFKGVKYPIGSAPGATYNRNLQESSGLIVVDNLNTHGGWVFLEWRSDVTGTPPFSGAFYVWQHTSFPSDDLDGDSIFFPLWYFPHTGGTLGEQSTWERWISLPGAQGLS
jgi:hypothetical protein